MRVLVTGAAGKLGSVIVTEMIERGHTVYVRDTNERVLFQLLSGEQPYYDKSPRFFEAQCYNDEVDIDVNLIVVDTPSREDGSFDTTRALACGLDHALNVLVSTVNPGDTPPGWVYNPTMIAIGEMNFTRHLFAGADRPVYERLRNLWKCEVRMMSLREAELTKLAINCYLTTKISFANQLAELCYDYDADANVVCEAVGADYRVGKEFFKPGLPFGGPCLPRDTNAMLAAAKNRSGALMLQMELNNSSNEDWCHFICEQYGIDEKTAVVGILGMAYKPGVPYWWDSAGLQLAKYLESEGIEVRKQCPWAFVFADDLSDCDVVIILHGADRV